MKYPFVYCIIYIMLAGCGTKDTYIHIQTLGNVTIVDSSHSVYTHPYPEEDSSAVYPIYYIGPMVDTFRLPAQPIASFKNYPADQPLSLLPNTGNLRITVVPFRLTHCVPEFVDSSQAENPKVYPAKAYAAFGILLQNLSDTSMYLDYANLLMNTVRQVKTENGTWKDTEKPMDYACVTNRKEIYLPAWQVLIAKLPRYTRTGALQTFRLRYSSRSKDTVYSNTFMD